MSARPSPCPWWTCREDPDLTDVRVTGLAADVAGPSATVLAHWASTSSR